jgi:hypothetical protein
MVGGSLSHQGKGRTNSDGLKVLSWEEEWWRAYSVVMEGRMDRAYIVVKGGRMLPGL